MKAVIYTINGASEDLIKLKSKIFVLFLIFFTIPLFLSAQEPCDRINITPATSRKPDFNTFLSGVRGAVVAVFQSSVLNVHRPAFNALNEYLLAIGFETVETLNMDNIGGFGSYCEKAVVQIGFDYSYNDVFSNIRMKFDYEDYRWEFSTRRSARNQYEFGQALRDMYGNRKPAFNCNNAIKSIKRKTCWTETTYRNHVISKGCDAIEGIYQNASGGINYKVALRKMYGKYHLIYLSGAPCLCEWDEGEVKAFLEPTATPMLFSARWIMADKTDNNSCFISFEQGLMNVMLDGTKDLYVKLFPSVSDNFGNPSSNSEGSGTGFALSSNGYIVTNNHVIDKAKSIEVKGVNGNFTRKYTAEVVVSDERNDLAIIKINDTDFTTLGSVPYIFRQGIADVGENIFVLGYPMTSTMGEEIKLTNGIISSRTGYQGDISMYQISAPVQPGNSGGPLFDKNGNIIGVVSAKHTLAENAGYAIKISYIRNLIDMLPQRITLPQTSQLNGKSLTEQVKNASRHVYIIEVK